MSFIGCKAEDDFRANNDFSHNDEVWEENVSFLAGNESCNNGNLIFNAWDI